MDRSLILLVLPLILYFNLSHFLYWINQCLNQHFWLGKTPTMFFLCSWRGSNLGVFGSRVRRSYQMIHSRHCWPGNDWKEHTVTRLRSKRVIKQRCNASLVSLNACRKTISVQARIGGEGFMQKIHVPFWGKMPYSITRSCMQEDVYPKIVTIFCQIVYILCRNIDIIRNKRVVHIKEWFGCWHFVCTPLDGCRGLLS